MARKLGFSSSALQRCRQAIKMQNSYKSHNPKNAK